MIYDSIDFAFDLDGDFVVDAAGDIQDTEFDVLVGVVQAINSRIAYPQGSWRLYPDIGVIEQPIGKLNSLETSEEWEDFIIAALTEDGMVEASDIELASAPLSENTFMTLVKMRVMPTDANGGRTGLNFFSIFDLNKQVARFY